MTDKSVLETDVRAAIAAGKIAGAIICASDKAGQFQYKKTFGERTLLSGEKKAHQLNDVLVLASATKLIATISALQCVEDGLLTLNGDLSIIAPELAAKQVLTGWAKDADGKETTPILEPQTRPITLEMLLSHSSGVAYHFLEPGLARWRSQYGNAGAQEKLDPKDRQPLAVEDTFDYPLIFQPGTAWAYGPGADWAGRIVERVTNRPLIEFMEERILKPLGVSGEASFYPVTEPSLRARLVDLNPSDPDGVGRAVIGGDPKAGDHFKLNKGAFGGHGLFATGETYHAVLHSLLANDGRILQPATVELMTQQHLNAEASANHHKLLDGPLGIFCRVGAAPGTAVGFGLGGLVTMQDEAWAGAGEHTIAWGGGHTFAWFVDRKNDLAGFVAVQASLPFDAPTVNALKQTFREDIYNIRKDSKAGKS